MKGSAAFLVGSVGAGWLVSERMRARANAMSRPRAARARSTRSSAAARRMPRCRRGEDDRQIDGAETCSDSREAGRCGAERDGVGEMAAIGEQDANDMEGNCSAGW